MTSNHSDRPLAILQRIFATTHQRDSVCSTSNGTVASFHSCSSIIAHVESRISRRIVVNETPGGASDGPEIREGSQIEGLEGSEDIPANDDNSPHHDRTYQFDNCYVYLNSFNARGIRVKDSGNNTQRARVTHHGGTVPNEGPPSSSKLSRPSTRPKAPAFCQSSHRHQDFRPDFTFGSPPQLPFQPREPEDSDNSSYTLEDFPSAPPVGIDVPFPTIEQKQPTKRGKLPATVDATLMQIMQSNPVQPVPTASSLPGLESQRPHPINPILPIHMGLHPNFLSHSILQPFSDDAPNNNTANNWNASDSPSLTNLHPYYHYPATPNSSRHHPDINLKSLEQHLHSALGILIQTSGGILGDGVTPQARNTLRAINALVSMEKPIYNPPPRFKSVRKLVKWLRIPRSPK